MSILLAHFFIFFIFSFITILEKTKKDKKILFTENVTNVIIFLCFYQETLEIITIVKDSNAFFTE